MEGKIPKVKREVTVRRSFECSRLERELLAVAYERVVPHVRHRFLVADVGNPAGVGRVGLIEARSVA